MYVGTEDGEDCVTIMPATAGKQQVVRIAVRHKDKISVVYYTQEQFALKMQQLALRAAYPVFFGICKLANWMLVTWAIWKLIHG